MSENVETLMEMGFDRNKAEKALAKTNYKGVQEAMDWLFAHQDDPDIDEPFEAPKGNVLSAAETVAGSEGTTESSSASGEEPVALSLKCDICEKQLRSEVEAQAHAARTGHTEFSQSTEEVKPLTAEEKAQQIVKLEQLRKEKRLRREEQEKKDQKDKEIQRRLMGKDLTSAKAEHDQKELRVIAEQKRKEKLDDKLAKQKILDQIKADKDARKAAQEAAKAEREGRPVPQVAQAAAPATVPQAAPTEKKEYTECKLQVRLPSGQPITQTFSASEPLGAVKLYVRMNSDLEATNPGRDFTFMTTFPRRVYTVEEMEAPLKSLGLVPSAVVMVSWL